MPEVRVLSNKMGLNRKTGYYDQSGIGEEEAQPYFHQHGFPHNGNASHHGHCISSA